ncbi:MAG TPA: D-alanine--D-alanine ligase [Rhodothermales bacterium]|nr:D-alanine--D-alanine ligase [Rhodothermales bacterium]
MAHRLRIGLVYDTFEHFVWRPGDPPDADAELEPWETVEALEAAFRHLGHEPVRIGPTAALLDAIPLLRTLDAALSIAEGRDGVGREGHAPAIFEATGVPYLGSDALTLSLSLDKHWTNTLVDAAGVRTPERRVFASAAAVDDADLPPFPLFVKPRYEGSSKGIALTSKVQDQAALRAEVARVTKDYRQDALVEAFVEGSEFTVAVVGHDPPRTLPVLQRAVEAGTGIGLHALERRGLPEAAYGHRVGMRLTPNLEARLQASALRAFETLRCRDFARMDFRVTDAGEVFFLEANPLPTFAPDGTFAILAELSGIPYEVFLGRVFADGLRRLGLG